jgi:hypothetical protein
MTTQAIPIPDVLALFTPSEKARLLRPGEVIPSQLDVGFDLLGKLDPEWIWVLDYAGEIRGVLIAAPCHGVAFIWRLALLPGQPPTSVVRLLRRFLRDIRRREMIGYMTLVDLGVETQSRLTKIIEHAGGGRYRELTLVCAPMPREGI